MVVTETIADQVHPAMACAHCGLPSPPPESAGEPAFCCAGCRGAYQLIHGWGLQDYYALRDRLGGDLDPQPVAPGSRFDELDDPVVLGQYAPKAVGGGRLACRLAVDGLHCGACAWLIERAARSHPGFDAARVRFNDRTVEIIYRPDETKLSQIAAALAKLGYRLAPLVDDEHRARAAAENRALLVPIAVAGFCAANAMWIAVALYAGGNSGMAAEHETVLRWAGVVLGLIAVVFPGRTFFRGAWASLQTKTPHMDLPVALGLSVGVGAGLVAVIKGHGEVYFDSVATLVFFLLVGRWIQFRQQRRAADSVSLLLRLTPQLARQVMPDGTTRSVLADRLSSGDTIRVAAGETLPADGTVVRGTSSLDRSLVTGESRPVAVEIGTTVEAGCGNLAAELDVRVTAAGRDSRVGRLTQLIEDASSQRAPIVQLADSIGGWFVVVVIVLAGLTVGIWWRTDPYLAANHAVALLIVACPCALALATPLALAVAIGRAARRRILIRGGDVLEAMGRPGIVWLDKTGTLTSGDLRLLDWDGDDQSLAYAAAVEQSSAHPVAVALRAAARERKLVGYNASQSLQRTGSGITGVVNHQSVAVGNVAHVRQQGAVVDHDAETKIDRLTESGLSPVLVAINGVVCAIGAIGDQLRPSAKPAIDALRAAGWKVRILSGDHPETVSQIARQLELTPDQAIGGVHPEAKLQHIEQSKRTEQTVMMVGDGVNDAAALAAADIGIAVRGGAAASLQAAPVYLSTGDLGGLSELVAAARCTMRTIRRNFVISLGYNVVVVMFAMAGMIDPLVAAILMPISSLSVLTMVLVSPTFKTERATKGLCQSVGDPLSIAAGAVE